MMERPDNKQWTMYLSRSTQKMLKCLKLEPSIQWKNSITPIVPQVPKVGVRKIDTPTPRVNVNGSEKRRRKAAKNIPVPMALEVEEYKQKAPMQPSLIYFMKPQDQEKVVGKNMVLQLDEDCQSASVNAVTDKASKEVEFHCKMISTNDGILKPVPLKEENAKVAKRKENKEADFKVSIKVSDAGVESGKPAFTLRVKGEQGKTLTGNEMTRLVK